MAMELQNECRFCLKKEKPKHYIWIFSAASIKQSLPDLLNIIFDQRVDADDGRSKHACRSCVSSAKAIQSKLRNMRAMALKSYHDYENQSLAASHPQKRRKDTAGGDGVSPMTQNLQPPRKRCHGMGRRLVFEAASLPVPEATLQEPIPLGPEATLQEPIPLGPEATLQEPIPLGPEATLQEPIPEVVLQEPVTDPAAMKSVNVTVHSPHRDTPYTAQLDSSLCRIGRAITGGNMDTIVRSILSHDVLHDPLIKKVIQIITDECLTLCRRSQPTVFRKSTPDECQKFKWSRYEEAMKSKSPILFQLLMTIVSHGDRRNEKKKGDHHLPCIIMAVSVLLKARNREMVGLQTCIGLLLYSSRVPKQLYVRLNHLGITASYSAVLKVVSSISESYLKPVEEFTGSSVPFKFVGDNVDKHKHVRDIRSNHHGKMVHMYSLLLIRSRGFDSSLSFTGTAGNLPASMPTDFLPTKEDVHIMKLNITILISRILCKYIDCLHSFAKLLPQHIPHKYYNNMTEVSETYFLDVLMKHEAKHSDMIDIMKEMQSYLGKNANKVISGGDQLTCERQACAQRHMMDGDVPEDRIQLVEPVCEDWHALMCFLKVIWKRLFKPGSRDHGTFGYFCSMLGRLPKAKDPKKDMNACTDVLFTVLKGHYVASACSILGISKPTDTPEGYSTLKLKGKNAKIDFVAKLATQVAHQFSIIDEAILGQEDIPTKDAVYDYARVFCHFGSLALEFKNAWEEGDGERSIRCWKVLLLHFRCSNCIKYAWEALRLQFQLLHLPPALSHQVKWQRYVNTHGGPGRNIPCDLFNEHINKLFKEVISSMGANMTESTLQKAARSVTTLSKIRETFDRETNIPPPTVAHATKSDMEDVFKVTEVLVKNQCLVVHPGRILAQYKSFNGNPFHGLNWKQLLHWIERKKKEVLTYKYAIGEGDLSCSEMESSSDDS